MVQHIIMLPQHIIMGMPAFIMAVMRSQHSVNISIDMPSIGIISQVMPVLVMVQVTLHIIIGMDIGIIEPIIGIMPGMPPIGIIMPGIIEPIMGFIMPPIIGFIIGMGIIIGCIFMAVFMTSSSCPRDVFRRSMT